MITVREATPADLESAAASLATAFDRDPLSQWIVPDAEGRLEGMRAMFEHRLPEAVGQGATVLVTDDLGAAAVWLPPGMNGDAVPPPDAREEVVAFFSAINAAHPIRPHWYLEWLGAKEGQAGRGSALVRHMLETTDSAGMPTALWTSTERNLDFYGKHGYTVLERIDLGAVSGWWLWREAQ